MLLLGLSPSLTTQDVEKTEPVLSERAGAARDLVEAWGTRTFEVFQGEELVERVVLSCSQVQRGEEHFLEFVLDRHRPPTSQHPERLLTRLTLDQGLTPFDVRLWEPSEERTQLASLSVARGKLTGRVRGKGVVRNVPEPVVSESSLILFAALLPREEDAHRRVARLTFGKKGVTVGLDERVVFDGFEEREGRRLARIEHRDPRGKVLGVMWFDEEGQLAERSVGGRKKLVWRPEVLEEDEQ
jgi:hypothetical protein